MDCLPAAMSRRGGTVPTSQPGVSWPHETHMSEIRPRSKCRSESCPRRPHRNCLAPIDTRLTSPPSEGGAEATGRFCVECVAMSQDPSFRTLDTDFVRASGRPESLQDECHGIARFLADSGEPHTRVSLQKRFVAEKWSQIAGIFRARGRARIARAHRSRSNAFTTNATLAGRSPSRRMK